MKKDTYLSANGCAIACQLNMFIAWWKNTTKQQNNIHYSGRKDQEEIDSQQAGIQTVTNIVQEDA